MPASSCSNDQLIDRADALHAQVCRTQVDLLEVLAELDDRGSVWEDWGAQDMAHWVSMRYGVSYYRAERWIGAGHALKELPLVSEAFASGELSLDKVVELTRFATPETEQVLVAWARGVSAGRIRHQAELLRKAERDEAAQADRDRSVSWYFYDQGRRFAMSTDLPAAEGTRLVRALDRRARSLPIMPGEHGPWGIEARRADALVAMASEHLAADPDPDRATVIVHARVGGGESANGGPIAGPLHAAELEAGPVLHPLVAERLLCSARVQVVVEDATGQPLRLGRMRREPPEWMLRQLKYRDRECVFPGCAHRRFVHAHHILWWEQGGTTDLDNLVLVCTFHHKLVHEYGWRLTRGLDGEVRWFHPEGTRYLAGPAPPRKMAEGLAVSSLSWPSLNLQKAAL